MPSQIKAQIYIQVDLYFFTDTALNWNLTYAQVRPPQANALWPALEMVMYLYIRRITCH